MSKLELTKRDLLVFEMLGSYGLMSAKQLVRLMFSGIDESIALRRLRRLRIKGYLTAHSGLEHVTGYPGCRGHFRASEEKSQKAVAGPGNRQWSYQDGEN